MLAARVPKYIDHGLPNVQLRIGPKRLQHGKNRFWIRFDDASEALTRRSPDVGVTVLRPSPRGLKDRARMPLAEFDERRGGYFSRLPLVARGELPEFWKYGVGLDPTSANKLLDILNLAIAVTSAAVNEGGRRLMRLPAKSLNCLPRGLAREATFPERPTVDRVLGYRDSRC